LPHAAVVGANPLILIRWFGGVPRGTDTASVQVRAQIFNTSGPLVVGQSLPVFAADRVPRLVRFASVGRIPPFDTVRLGLRVVAP